MLNTVAVVDVFEMLEHYIKKNKYYGLQKKYKMALEGIQEILSSGEDSIRMSRLQLRLQGIFPELSESEDERMSRELIAYFRNNSVSVKWSGLDVN